MSHHFGEGLLLVSVDLGGSDRKLPGRCSRSAKFFSQRYQRLTAGAGLQGSGFAGSGALLALCFAREKPLGDEIRPRLLGTSAHDAAIDSLSWANPKGG